MFRLTFAFFFFLFFSISHSYSSDKIHFIDLDELIAKSKLGSSIVTNLNTINSKNIEQLKLKEKEIKQKENELQTKRNIISKDEFEKELKNLNSKVNLFKKQKDEMVKKFKVTQNEKIKDFFNKINPLIQNYMDENSITILLDRKNVFIGKETKDITNDIILLIDKTFNN